MKHNLEMFHEVREIMHKNDIMKMVKMHKITKNNEKLLRKSHEITEIILSKQRYSKQFVMSVIFVWYAVWFIFLTSPNDCKLFHLRYLIEFAWQISHSSKTSSS